MLFAKAPIAGHVKTRLQTHCNAQQAADIAEILLEATVERVCESWPGSVFISTWLDAEHSSLVRISRQFSIPIVNQCEGDLGVKMRDAFNRFGYPMAIIGSDAPHTAPRSLHQLHDNLKNGRSTIGPSHDGGYYLIGLCQKSDYLFEGVNWGTNSVLNTTREKAKRSQLSFDELDYLADVDEWNDVLSVSVVIPKLNAYLIDQNLLNKPAD